jgi:hypothetical protein
VINGSAGGVSPNTFDRVGILPQLVEIAALAILYAHAFMHHSGDESGDAETGPQHIDCDSAQDEPEGDHEGSDS